MDKCKHKFVFLHGSVFNNNISYHVRRLVDMIQNVLYIGKCDYGMRWGIMLFGKWIYTKRSIL